MHSSTVVRPRRGALAAGLALVLVLGLAASAGVVAQPAPPSMPGMMSMPMPMHAAGSAPAAAAPAAPAPDTRVAVEFPEPLRSQTLATMREHLQGLAGIAQAMSQGELETAARIATQSLGMSSMHGEQAQQEARYMPQGMRELGMRLHVQAGEFAVAAQDAAATGDLRRPQRLYGEMMQTCVACHAAYRLR